jgi:hypothetical protein
MLVQAKAEEGLKPEALQRCVDDFNRVRATALAER